MNPVRVLVTGVGVISPLALSAPTHFDRLLRGESAIQRAAQSVYRDYTPQLEARVSGYNRQERIRDRMLRKLLSPSAGYAVGAAGEAIGDAGLLGERMILEKCGLYVGSLSLEIEPDQFIEPLRASLTKDGIFDISLFATRGMKVLDPLFLVKALPNGGVAGISVEHQVLGPNTNLTNGATSGLMAVGLAINAILRGEADCALAGGYDTLLGMDSIAEHLIADRLSRHHIEPQYACRPFDRTRHGYVLGEGAAFVFLESALHARQRGARAYAEIFPSCQTTNTSLLRNSDTVDGTALAWAGRQALQAAGCEVADLGIVFGDGLGTDVDDLREYDALQRLLKEAKVPYTTATSACGFTGAASGVFSLVHAVMALREQVILPLLSCQSPDPRCQLHFVRQPEYKAFKSALVWNSDRGIKNVAMIVGANAK